MARYIDAERMPNDCFWEGLTDKEKTKVLQWLLQSPTADVEEVRHGIWIEVDQTGRNSRHIKYTTKKCSVCGYCNGRRKTKRCPECGAKMDGERRTKL